VKTVKLGQTGCPVNAVASSDNISSPVFLSLYFFNSGDRVLEACSSPLCISSVCCNVLAFICHVAFQLEFLITLRQYRNTKNSVKGQLLNGNAAFQLWLSQAVQKIVTSQLFRLFVSDTGMSQRCEKYTNKLKCFQLPSYLLQPSLWVP